MAGDKTIEESAAAAQKEAQGGPVLRASAQTLPIGSTIREKALQWSNVDKGLLVVSRADFVDYLKEQPDFEQVVANTRDDAGVAGARLPEEEQAALYYKASPDKAGLTEGFFNQYPEIPFADFLKRDTEDEFKYEDSKSLGPPVSKAERLYDMKMEAYGGFFFKDNTNAVPFSFNATEARAEYGILIEGGEAAHASAKDMISETARLDMPLQKLPDRFAKAADGPDGYGRQIKQIHEYGHMRDPLFFRSYDLSNPDRFRQREELRDSRHIKEAHADSFALTEADDMPLAEAVGAARAVGALHIHHGAAGPSSDVYFEKACSMSHATRINLDDDNKLLSSSFNKAALSTAVVNVNSMAFLVAGNVLKDDFMAQENARENLSAIYGKYVSLLKKGYISEEKGSGLSSSLLNEDPVVEMMVGEHMVAGDQKYHYAALKTVLEKGYFPEGSPEERLASQFVEGYEALSPERAASPEVNEFMKQVESWPEAPEALQSYLQSLKPEDFDVSRDRKGGLMPVSGRESVEENILRHADKVMRPDSLNNG